jgi:hypothetical protein
MLHEFHVRFTQCVMRDWATRTKNVFWVVVIAHYATTYIRVLYGSTHNNYVLEDCCHVLYLHLPRP